MSEGPGGPQGATAGGTLAMRMLSQQAMVASQMKRAANDKAIAQMLAAKKSGPPAARLDDEIQHKSFLGALAGAVLGAISVLQNFTSALLTGCEIAILQMIKTLLQSMEKHSGILMTGVAAGERFMSFLASVLAGSGLS